MTAPTPMTSIEVYDESALPEHLAWQLSAAERIEWADLVDDSLPWGPRSYALERRSRYVVAVDGQVLVGAAVVVAESGQIADTDVTISGVGTVFVFPSRRGHGVARSLVERATVVVDESEADIGALFCVPSLEGLYASCGWTVAPGGTRLAATGAAHPDSRMMRPVSTTAWGLGELLLTDVLHVDSAW